MSNLRTALQALDSQSPLDDVFERDADFVRLARDPAVERLREIISRAYHEAAEIALDQPELACEMRGLRKGVRLFFALLDEGVEEYRVATRKVAERDTAEPAEPDSSLVFGMSPL